MIEMVNPPELGRHPGWTNGVVTPAGRRLLFVAGQTAADPDGAAIDADFVGQFEAALGKALKVVEAAGGGPGHVVRMTVYVSDIDAYRQARPALGDVWKARMGPRYPAMTLVEVSRLLDEGAMVEIEATAVLP